MIKELSNTYIPQNLYMSAPSTSLPNMLTNLRFKYSVKRELINAINHGNFNLVYQPQTALASNKVIAVEALLRWNCPEYGMVPPGEFIPIAEKSGLINELGNLVIDKVCEQAAYWKKHYNSNLRIAVNVSYLQVHTNKIVRFIEQCLSQYHLDASVLEIELTESSLIRDKDVVCNVMNELKEMGIRTAIDDFGTGYSSLSYLSCMPFDLIKIDRSFISALGRNSVITTVTESIIRMGKRLGMEVLAEGVETRLQKDILIENQCDLIQGNLICKPVPADKIPEVVGLCE